MSDDTPTEKKSARTSWAPIVPVPEDAPKARLLHPVRGEPTSTHPYHDVDGRLLGYVCRFIRSAGGVHSLALTWCRNEIDGSFAWKWIQFRKLRPMYGAQNLDVERRNIVMVVGDELNVDELLVRRITYAREAVKDQKAPAPFIEFDFVSWPGGRSKLGDVDWSPLKGRVVAIWLPHSAERFKVAREDLQAGAMLPAERQPWHVASRLLKDTLVAFGAIPISIAEAKAGEELPDGWDAVSALNAGWDFNRLHKWYEEHFATPEEVEEARRLAAGTVAVAPRPQAGDPPWMRSLLRKDGFGPLLPEIHNVRMILSKHEDWREVIWFDEFSHRVMKAKPPPFDGAGAGEWSDFDDSMSTDWLSSKCGILKLRSSLVAEGVHAVARLHAKNPLVDYLRGCRKKWEADGRKNRLDKWLTTYMSAGEAQPDDTAADIERIESYLKLIGRMWMKGAVARALAPGIKFDYVLILEGQQGLGKSSALAILGGDWAMDTPFSLSDKEGWESLQGTWIVEIAELDAMNKADVRTAKTFFSRRKDRFRLPFARRTAEFPRTCVFGGSTNEGEYFRDRTGNRRYLPAHCVRAFARSELERDRDLLFGEAVAAFEAGERLYFTAEEERQVRVEQRRRMRQDPWFGDISRFLAAPDRALESMPITINRLLREALRMEISRVDEHGHSTRVGHALAELGYERKENKSIPERYHYVKRQGSHEDDA